MNYQNDLTELFDTSFIQQKVPGPMESLLTVKEKQLKLAELESSYACFLRRGPRVFPGVYTRDCPGQYIKDINTLKNDISVNIADLKMIPEVFQSDEEKAFLKNIYDKEAVEAAVQDAAKFRNEFPAKQELVRNAFESYYAKKGAHEIEHPLLKLKKMLETETDRRSIEKLKRHIKGYERMIPLTYTYFKQNRDALSTNGINIENIDLYMPSHLKWFGKSLLTLDVPLLQSPGGVNEYWRRPQWS